MCAKKERGDSEIRLSCRGREEATTRIVGTRIGGTGGGVTTSAEGGGLVYSEQ